MPLIENMALVCIDELSSCLEGAEMAISLLHGLRRAIPSQNGAAREARHTISDAAPLCVRVHRRTRESPCRLSAQRHSLA